jgi:rubrerythrin
MEKYGYEPENPPELEKRAGKSSHCPACGATLQGSPPVCPNCGSRPFEKRRPNGQEEESGG